MAIELATAWTITKTAAEVSKRLYELAKNLKERDLKQQVDEILDKMRELKQSASELEDENRALRERLRFKSEESNSDIHFGTTNRVLQRHSARGALRAVWLRQWASPVKVCSREVAVA